MGRPFDGMIGDCAAMREVFAVIERLAPSDITVLVLGETGTGKELVARSLHARSRRRGGPFVAVNCAALPAPLVESELFGFEKGSFTGAVAASAGRIESADGGTLFLDEIAEMPLGAQAKLLRVAQQKVVQRLGAARERSVDVRIVAATHQDLAGLVEARTFRRDLFHRLDEARIVLPPLRERGDDVAHIAAAIVERLGRELGRPLLLGAEAGRRLLEYDWPGNVRELENALRRAATRAAGPSLEPCDLDLVQPTPPRTLAEILATATESAQRAALRRHGGDAEAAARELGISRPEFDRLAERWRSPPVRRG
jgi:two-component system NtrC family response regulator